MTIPLRCFQLMISAVLLVTLSSTPKPAFADTPPNTGSWRLIFGDEFNDANLNTAAWGLCDFYAVGASSCSENTPGGMSVFMPDDVYLSNGTLKLRTQRRQVCPTSTCYDFTGGVISQRNKFSFTYGFVEARIKMAAGRGQWGGLFTLPVARRNYPYQAPEIDIAENVGNEPKAVHMFYHYPDVNLQTDYANRQATTYYVSPTPVVNEWHTYAVWWAPSFIIYYIDGVERFRVTDRITNEPAYLIAKLSLGTTFGGNQTLDATSIFPATAEVDYIRIWQQGATAPPPETVIDTLDDTRKISAFSNPSFFAIEKANSLLVSGDSSRLLRYQSNPQWVGWKQVGMRQFGATAYFWNSNISTHLHFWASANNTEFTQFTPTIEVTPGQGGAWTKVRYTVQLPPGMTFMRVVYPYSSQYWSPQIGEVSYTTALNTFALAQSLAEPPSVPVYGIWLPMVQNE